MNQVLGIAMCKIQLQLSVKTYGDVELYSTILDFGARWMSVVSITPWPLSSQGKRPPRGLQIRPGRCGEEKNLFPLQRSEPRTPNPSAVQPVVRRYTDWAITDLYCIM
jgi:hypothetical protein